MKSGTKLNAAIIAIRRDMRMLRPVRTAGILTSQTSQGVTRRPAPQTGGQGTGTGVARWA